MFFGREWLQYWCLEYLKSHPKPNKPETDDPEAVSEYVARAKKWSMEFQFWLIEHAGQPVPADFEYKDIPMEEWWFL